MVPCLFQVLAFVSWVFFFLAIDIHGQQDFLSIDCGMLENQSYIDPNTSMTYVSDNKLIDVTHVPFTFDISANKVISFTLNKTSDSDLPPMLNAAEIYIQTSVSGDSTDPSDVVSMMTIKSAYKMSKWQGDPCRGQSPWANVTCTDIAGTPSKITSLNFSSLGLTGGISSGFENLTALQNLDLSNNNLAGPVPEFLGKLPSLKSLNLSRNNFKGTIPSILLQRQHSEKSGLFIDDKLVQSQCRRFSYEELRTITKDFKDVVGQGGFGKVYHGLLEDGTEVAVKLRSFISPQGAKEFQAEAWLLSRIHHRNMVCLIGYCDENNSLALVYEFMANGSLQELLTGQRRTITWRKRLKIALEAAQGLEYLHKACTPPIIHRDIKSSNILLTNNLNAKIADFGLSRALLTDDQTHITATFIAGTPGYLDPEYTKTYRLTEKSDVYAFGVVLLELVTGLPAILPELETVNGNSNLVDWVNFHLQNDSMNNIIDSYILNKSDLISVNKAVSLAVLCTNTFSNGRPSMSEVVHEVKEIIGTDMDTDVDNFDVYDEGRNNVMPIGVLWDSNNEIFVRADVK
ncbi:hypothetical protein LUZ60_002358 [Juncus effusus]|nr:hypothetical protein LUZ60_002358 [Juncus effusus]